MLGLDPELSLMEQHILHMQRTLMLLKALQLLIEKRGKNAGDNCGRSLWLSVVGFNSHNPQSLLLRLGVHHQCIGKDGNLLHAAAEVSDEMTLKTIAIHGFRALDIDAKYSNGLTAL